MFIVMYGGRSHALDCLPPERVLDLHAVQNCECAAAGLRGSTRMSADRATRRDGSSYTTIPSQYVLVIREHPRESAVKLFANY